MLKAAFEGMNLKMILKKSENAEKPLEIKQHYRIKEEITEKVYNMLPLDENKIEYNDTDISNQKIEENLVDAETKEKDEIIEKINQEEKEEIKDENCISLIVSEEIPLPKIIKPSKPSGNSDMSTLSKIIALKNRNKRRVLNRSSNE